MQHEFAVFEGKERTGSGAVGGEPTGTEERRIGRQGLEPEHQGLVVVRRAGQEVACQLDGVVLQLQRDTFLQFPGSTREVEIGAVGFVNHDVALTLVHAVVGQQFAFVAGQVVAVGGGNLVQGEGLGPEACLQHVAGVAQTVDKGRRCAQHRLVGQRTRSGVGHLGGTGIEADGLGIVVKGHDDAGELQHGGLQLTRGDAFLAHLDKEAVVGRLTEQQVDALHHGIGEEGLLIIGVGGAYQHIQRERLARKRTADFGMGIGVGRAVEVDGRAGGDAGLVGDALELEVVVLVQVVAGDGFREAELQVIADAEDGVGGFRLAEQDGRTGVLHTADDGRSLAYKARTEAAEADGTQVVLLFHRVALAVETEGLDAAVLYHGLVAGGQVVEAVVGVERAQVHPHLVTFLA